MTGKPFTCSTVRCISPSRLPAPASTTVSRMSPLATAKPWTTRRKLRGQKLYIDRAHALSLADDEVYISDLIGCAAVDETGASLGKLTDVLQHGAVDVYVFQSDKGEWMAPALKAVFPAVDVQNRIIRVVREKLDEVAVYNE